MGFLVARSTCLSDDQVNEIYGQLDLRDILASSGSSSSRNGGEGGGGNSKYEDDDDDDDGKSVTGQIVERKKADFISPIDC